MVIMALLAQGRRSGACGKESEPTSDGKERQPLEIATPTRLPEAIAGRSYLVALAATGGRGPLHWSVEGTVPEWLSLDEANGQLAGTPPKETAEPLTLAIGVSDGAETATQLAQLLDLAISGAVVRRGLAQAAAARGRLARLAGTRHRLSGPLAGPPAGDEPSGQPRARVSRRECRWLRELAATEVSVQKRFVTYRLLVRLTTLSAMVGMAVWLYLAMPSPTLTRRTARIGPIHMTCNHPRDHWSASRSERAGKQIAALRKLSGQNRRVCRYNN